MSESVEENLLVAHAPPSTFEKKAAGGKKRKKEGENGRGEEKYLIGVGASVSREILRVISRGMEGNS